MTGFSSDEPGNSDAAEKNRRRSAWILLATHAVAFVALLFGFMLRVRYVEAEGVHVDWLAIVLAIAGTVVFIVLLALLLVSRRRTALRRALTKNGIHGPFVLGYWSRTSNSSFLTEEVPGPRGSGVDVAVTSDADGIHVQALVRRRLVDFGLIPWSHVETIEGGRKTVGVGVRAKGGVLHIALSERTPPYADRLEFFPTGQAGIDAARALLAHGPSV